MSDITRADFARIYFKDCDLTEDDIESRMIMREDGSFDDDRTECAYLNFCKGVEWQAARAQQGEGREVAIPEFAMDALEFYAKCSHMSNPVENGKIALDAITRAVTTAHTPKQKAVLPEPFAYYRHRQGHEMLFASDVGSGFICGDGWTPLYTHPPKAQGVPEGWKVWETNGSIGNDMIVEHPDGKPRRFFNRRSEPLMFEFLRLLVITPPADKPEGEWKPAHGMSDELPEIGQPVMGHHPDWVDEDFCKDGIRECFLFGDGSEWQSARWDGYCDQWIVEDGAPELWCPHPAAPDMGGD